MAWIKRNLIFVVSAAVGVLLVLGAAYYLYTGWSDNTQANEDFKAALGELETMQSKNPFPSKENIELAKADQQRVRDLLAEYQKTFIPFPAPPKTDEKEFKSLLSKTIAQLQMSATNAGVGLPMPYYFSFSAIYSDKGEKIIFPAESIGPWMTQLEEIKTICDVLYHSKISFLEGLRRVPVAADDQGGGPDYLQITSVTNQNFVMTPYEISFRAFGSEIAAVMNGFQQAKNCFIIKSIEVLPGHATTTPMEMGLPAPAQAPVRAYIPPAPQRAPGGLDEMNPDVMVPRSAAAPVAAPVYRPTAPAGPATILSEKPLHVVILLNVVKIQAPAH